jgi:hypothetical protein
VRGSGLDLPPADDSRLVELSRATGVPLRVARHEIAIDWSRRPDLAPETRSEATEFAAALNAEPIIAASLIEHVIDLGLKAKDWGESQRATWIAGQREMLVKQTGSAAAADAAVAKAKSVLAGVNGKFARDMADSPMMNSIYWVLTLNNIAEARETFEAAKKRQGL